MTDLPISDTILENIMRRIAMENTYQHTPENGKEIVNAWFNYKLGKMQILLVVLLIIDILNLVFTPSTLDFILLVVIIGLMILYAIKRGQTIKMENDRLNVLYKEDYPTIITELTDEIHSVSPNADRMIAYSDIKKVAQSKNFIVLMMKGEMTVALHKDGFEEGTTKECLELLKQKMKSK